MKGKPQVLVIGGGAAGLLAAITAAREGAGVTLLEKKEKVGRKILATGNGRCNYTNTKAEPGKYMGGDPSFPRQALAQFTPENALDFFQELGIQPKIEGEGKVFPLSEQASSILDVLLFAMEDLGVRVEAGVSLLSLWGREGDFHALGEDGREWLGDRVILATGGKALPSSGSDGSGYLLAEALGHRITPLYPALVQLKLEGEDFKRLDGVKLRGTAALIHQGKVLAREEGDLLFASYGISGPPILQLSPLAGALLEKGLVPELRISCLPGFQGEELLALLRERFQRPGRTKEQALVGLIHKRLIPVVLKEAGLGRGREPASSSTEEDLKRLGKQLQDWSFRVKGTKGWTSAQVTAGGVDTVQVDAGTMESRLVPGLYFAGEVLDVHGYCGGFNLHWAWASGHMAGKAAGKERN